jgi:Regulator of Vps4 activity in the MVB pathway
VLQLKNSRKEVANLLRTGKAENARIRVETVMREEAMLQAYDGGLSLCEFYRVLHHILCCGHELLHCRSACCTSICTPRASSCAPMARYMLLH